MQPSLVLVTTLSYFNRGEVVSVNSFEKLAKLMSEYPEGTIIMAFSRHRAGNPVILLSERAYEIHKECGSEFRIINPD